MVSQIVCFAIANSLLASGFAAGVGTELPVAETFRSEAEKMLLVDKLSEHWNKIVCWRIEHELTPTDTNNQTASSVHRVTAAAAPGNLYYFLSHFSSIHPWKADPYTQEFFISHGRICRRWPFNRAYSEVAIKPGDGLPGLLGDDLLLAIIPRWPLTDYKAPAIVPSYVLRLSKYRLWGASDSVNGEKCVIFDHEGNDRLWIAVDKGLCVMRRDFSDPRSGKLRQRILTDRLNEVAPGVWLPVEFRSQFFSSARPADQQAYDLEVKVRVLECVVNAVSEKIFTPIHRPGSLRYDQNDDFIQASPGGEDLLSETVQFLTKYAKLPTKPLRQSRRWRWLAGGLTSGVCAGIFFGPRRRSHVRARSIADSVSG